MRFILWLPCLALTGCGLSLARFGEIQEAARACKPGDTCSPAGAGPCTCNEAVNTAKVAEVNDAAKSVACGGTVVDCVFYGTAQCINEKCTRVSP